MQGAILKDLIDQALLSVHTGFCARIVSINGRLATVQPLNMVKAIGGKAQKQAVIPNCPVLDSAVKFEGLDPVRVRRIREGDIVYCACADRDITDTKEGGFATPSLGHHSLLGTIVLGILYGGDV